MVVDRKKLASGWLVALLWSHRQVGELASFLSNAMRVEFAHDPLHL